MSAKAATKATPTKTLAATTEFECKGNAEQSLMDQVVFALRSLVETLCNQVEDLGNKHGSLQKALSVCLNTWLTIYVRAM
jgi:hypothetical protein